MKQEGGRGARRKESVERSLAVSARAPAVSGETDGQLEAASRGAVESSLSRLLGTLGLFSTASPSLTVEEIATRLKVPKSTA